MGTEEEGEEEAEELAGEGSLGPACGKSPNATEDGQGDLQRVGDETLASPAETVRVRDWKLLLGVSTEGDAKPPAVYCGDRRGAHEPPIDAERSVFYTS